MKWGEYAKRFIPDWQFDFSAIKRKEAYLEKYNKLWIDIGKNICNIYKE
jgi:hypothetical protein